MLGLMWSPGVEGKVHVADIYARLDPSFAAGDHEGAKAWKVAVTPRISFFLSDVCFGASLLATLISRTGGVYVHARCSICDPKCIIQ